MSVGERIRDLQRAIQAPYRNDWRNIREKIMRR